MNQSSSTTVATRSSRDLDVFEFREEDEIPVVYNHWSNRASCGSVNEIKEVHTVENFGVVALDDDEHGVIDKALGVCPDLLQKACLQGSEGFNVIADEVLELQFQFTEGGIEPESSPRVKTKFRRLFVHRTENGQIRPSILESQCLNGSVDMGASDGNPSFQERPPSTSASDIEENDDRKLPDHFIGGSEMDEVDLIALHTAYTAYGDKYFSNSLILISRDSVKMKASDFEEENMASSFEWRTEDILKIDSHWSSLGHVAKVRIRLLAEDAPQADNASGTSGVQVLEFLVCDCNWSQLQERIMSLDVRYKAALSIGPYGRNFDGDSVSVEDGDGSSDPYIPNFEESFEDVVYPKGDKDAVSISKSDVDLLQPEVFVNDTIIDFYITYLKNQIPSEERQRFHFFSSFFFRKLADLDKNPASISDGKAAFQRVRRWTRKVNLFEKDFIFIPVNYNLHWSLIILCYPGEVANFSDENIDEALKVPCILHMDSIRGSHAGLKDLFQSYLWEEWKERQKETSEDISAKFQNLRFLSLELPQQENCSDCGLFLLHYAELFIAEAPANFSPFQINKFDNFLMPDWFMPAEASLKRVHIQRLIYELLGSHSSDTDSATGNNLPRPSALPDNNETDNGIEIISESRSPRKSWNQHSLYVEPVQGMELGLLDMSLYRTAQCADDSSALCMTDFLEQCQSYGQGTGLGQSGFSMPNIREGEGNEHLAHSNLGQAALEPTDQAGDGECDIGYSSRDFDQEWNSEMSEQGDPDGNSSTESDYASDDSSKGTCVFGSDQEGQGAIVGQNEDLDELKENLDSFTESYASASSDMMETPAEDSQELADRYGSNNQEVPSPSYQEEVVVPSQEEIGYNEDGLVAGDDEKLVIKDSLPYNQKEVIELSQEELENCEDGIVAGGDTKLVVKDSLPSDQEAVIELSQEELENSEDGIVADGDKKLIVKDSLASNQEVIELSQEELQNNEDEIITRGGEKLVVKDPLPDSDEEQPAKRMRLTPSHCDGTPDEIIGDNMVAGGDEKAVLENPLSNSDEEQPAKRM